MEENLVCYTLCCIYYAIVVLKPNKLIFLSRYLVIYFAMICECVKVVLKALLSNLKLSNCLIPTYYSYTVKIWKLTLSQNEWIRLLLKVFALSQREVYSLAGHSWIGSVIIYHLQRPPEERWPAQLPGQERREQGQGAGSRDQGAGSMGQGVGDREQEFSLLAVSPPTYWDSLLQLGQRSDLNWL